LSNKAYVHLAAPLWLLFAGRDLLLGKAIELLRQIDSKGSLSKAAESIPMSYKSAWDLIDKLNNSSDSPLVTTTTGGRNGGGARLTDYGQSILHMYSSLERCYTNTVAEIENTGYKGETFLKTMKGLYMKTSARNQLAGKVIKISKGMVNSEIHIDINSNTITAVITNESTEELGLKKGVDVIILVKASAVILFPGDSPVKSSAGNMLNGKVIEIRSGAVNIEVILELSGGKTVTSVITKDSFESMGIKEGSNLFAAFNSSQVIIALPI
jgi:molybdate transport system regulatory protein